MKVLYLLRYFPTLTETFVYQEIDGLAARGVQVHIAALGERADGSLQDAAPQVPVHPVPRRPMGGWFATDTPGARWLKAHQRSKDVARLGWLTELSGGFDRLHVHFAGEAAEFARAIHLDTGIPYTVTVHAVDLFKPRPSLHAVLADAEAVLVVAEHHAKLLEAQGIASRVVRCGPDLTLWSPQPLPAGHLAALSVARAVPKKGLDLLLAAWDALDRPEARLQVVSDLQPRSLPPGVTLIGLQPSTVVREHMSAANLFVLPCRRAADGDMDGVPVVLMEALACGRPVLTTSISGIPELVDPAVGWIVPPDDVNALTAGLRAADDATERAQRGSQGPKRLRERGFHREEQVAGVLAAWGQA